MTTAKLFTNGRSQAVRLPKECRFEGTEVNVHKIGDVVFLLPITKEWNSFKEALTLFSDDFMSSGRNQKLQERPNL